MNKPWQPYALHILDAIAKIRRIEMRGDITRDEVLYDAALRNLQTMSEATQLLPDEKKPPVQTYHGAKSVASETCWCIIIWAISTPLPWPKLLPSASSRLRIVSAPCLTKMRIPIYEHEPDHFQSLELLHHPSR